MRRLRTILCLAFALAYLVPAQSRGDDVLCIEDSGKVSFGCSEIVDLARYAPGEGRSSGFHAPPDCGPCTDVQINWSSTSSSARLSSPVTTAELVAWPVKQLTPIRISFPVLAELDTGPNLLSSRTTLMSFRC